MKNSKSTLLLVTGLFGLLALSPAQTISQEEFLEQIQRNHPLFIKESLSSEIEAAGRDAYLGSEDWIISSGPYYARQNPFPPSGLSPERIDQTSIGATAQRVFWKTGGRLSLSWTSDYTKQHNLPDPITISIPGQDPFFLSFGEEKFYQNNAYLTYTQPLLQNYKGELDRLGYDLSQFSVNVAEVQAIENKEEFLLSMAIRFLDWVFISEQKVIAIERKNLADWQLEQAQKKREANLVDEVDVLRSEDAVRIAEQGVILITAQWKGKQAELAVLSKYPDLLLKTPEYDLYALVDRPIPEEAVQRLREQSRILKTLTLQQEQLSRQQRGLKEMTKPQLFLSTQLALKGGDEKFGDAAMLDKSDFNIALQYNYPLGNRTAGKQVEKIKLQARQIELTEEEVLLNLESSLRNLLIQIEELEKAMAINEQQIETARLKTQEELKRYNQGRGDLIFVIQSQDNEERAKLTYAQNAATYHSLNLRLKALLDDLLKEDTTTNG